MSKAAHQPDLKAHAAFQASPGVDSMPFETLEEALHHASMLGPHNRHPRARLVTASGQNFDWKQIDELVAQFRILEAKKPEHLDVRSSRV